MGSEPMRNPYTSHNTSPVLNSANIHSEMSRVERVRQALTTCGTNAAVVSMPATRPSRSVVVMVDFPGLYDSARQPRIRHRQPLGQTVDVVHDHVALEPEDARDAVVTAGSFVRHGGRPGVGKRRAIQGHETSHSSARAAGVTAG